MRAIRVAANWLTQRHQHQSAQRLGGRSRNQHAEHHGHGPHDFPVHLHDGAVERPDYGRADRPEHRRYPSHPRSDRERTATGAGFITSDTRKIVMFDKTKPDNVKDFTFATMTPTEQAWFANKCTPLSNMTPVCAARSLNRPDLGQQRREHGEFPARPDWLRSYCLSRPAVLPGRHGRRRAAVCRQAASGI